MPVPGTIDPAGRNSAFDTSLTTPFVAAFTAALSRGWKLNTLLAPGANVTAMAAANPGAYYRGAPTLDDPLDNLTAGFS